VLIVDDDADVRQMLATALRLASLNVDLAVDGAEALELLSENRYAVVLLDLMMPRMNGFDVLDAIHSRADINPPVVLVVSGADRSTLGRVDASRVHGIVRKPFDPHELSAVVVACVDIRGRNTLGTMAIAMISSAPLLAWLKL